MRRVESGEAYVGEIPLDVFRGDAFGEKRYLHEAIKIVGEGIERLGIAKDEPMRVCTGYILSGVREALGREGYTVVPSKITGVTQELAEEEFVKSLVRLGVGGEAEVRRMRRFSSLLKWVRQDLEGRERFVKTGWKAWRRIRAGEG
ncbi:hypothetical protein MUO93_02995 [Candidatus Bathyarchaeota archaeon]|jgi:hypothetical protein|nr:hypothetical protein [Candidatus Bathyarchaeota archaeon]